MATSIFQKCVTSCISADNSFLNIIRNASKKTGTSTRNQKTKSRPKHRGWRVQDGHFVSAGTILATQNKTRFHPGLNVGFGRNGTLYALEHGKVYVTCEKADPNWEHPWVQKNYANRQSGVFYKKYFNVIAEDQHRRFKLIDEV